MQATLIEANDNGRIAYDSLILSDPKAFGSLNNKLALKIIKSLAEAPACAIDISRRLKVNEQKIYYHINKLEKAGIVYTISNERRQGMIAKIYSVVSPVVAVKLFEKGVEVKDELNVALSKEVLEFFHPFINNGRFDAKIIIGSTKIHGKYESRAVDTPYLIDFLLFLGSAITNFSNSSIVYKFDTDVTEEDLKNNIILIGNPKINSITDRVNSLLPINFDISTDFRIISKLSGNKYPYDFDAVIIKTKNPFKSDKEMLVIAGRRSEGLRSAILAIMNHTKEILSGNIKNKSLIAKVVTGIDKDSDGVIDSVKFNE